MSELLLGVNIDHIATLRNARGTIYPDPVHAAFLAEKSGADSITVHLREDRRHITDRDIKLLRKTIQTKMNLEMSATEEMLSIACSIIPDFCCLVPENRQELTTEKGLDLPNQREKLSYIIKKLSKKGIKVSLFIDPEKDKINLAADMEVPYIEIHTGFYANSVDESHLLIELEKIRQGVRYATSLGLKVNAGHGLDYKNVKPIANIDNIYELNIGHSIISRSVLFGLSESVKKMKSIINEARK